jgi:cytochrome c oxidase subunit I+III
VVVALALGLAFLALEAYVIDEARDDFGPKDDAYGSIYYTLAGLHWLHVAAGVLLAAWVLVRTWRGPPPDEALSVTALYWHFTNVVAVVLFLTLTVVPRL